MHITDPVADMLTRIRNANSAKHDTVDVPASNMKKSIAQILLDEGYIKSFQVEEDGLQGMIHITLKYNAGKERVINGLRRVSKPGLRRYVGADELPRVLRGLGIAIISTSKGVMTDKKARELHVGGEVLAFVWKELEVNGVGYRVAKEGKNLVMNLGFSHQVIVSETEGITIDVPAPNKIVINGCDKQVVGQFAAEVREKRPPEPYKGKGIKYADEVIRRKVGKTGAKK